MVEERRTASRFSVRVPIEYENSRNSQNSHMGNGVTGDVSLSGVRIEHASGSMTTQTEIRLRFSFFMGSFDTEFFGTVVRHTKDSFSVQFVDMDKAQLLVIRRSLRLFAPQSN